MTEQEYIDTRDLATIRAIKRSLTPGDFPDFPDEFRTIARAARRIEEELERRVDAHMDREDALERLLSAANSVVRPFGSHSETVLDEWKGSQLLEAVDRVRGKAAP